MFLTRSFQKKYNLIRLLCEYGGYLLALIKAEELIDLACTENEVAIACALHDEIVLLIEEWSSKHGLN